MVIKSRKKDTLDYHLPLGDLTYLSVDLSLHLACLPQDMLRIFSAQIS